MTCCRLLDVITHESVSISKARRLGMFVSVATGGPLLQFGRQVSVSVNGDEGSLTSAVAFAGRHMNLQRST